MRFVTCSALLLISLAAAPAAAARLPLLGELAPPIAGKPVQALAPSCLACNGG